MPEKNKKKIKKDHEKVCCIHAMIAINSRDLCDSFKS